MEPFKIYNGFVIPVIVHIVDFNGPSFCS